MEKKEFLLADILSVLTERHLSCDGMNAIKGVLSFMADSPVSNITYLDDKLVKACQESIYKQHRQLKDIDYSGIDDDWEAWLEKQIKIFGGKLFLDQLLEVKSYPPNDS